jgi:hypothetical protein
MRFRLGSIRHSRWAKGRWAAAASATVVIVLALVGMTAAGVFAGSGAGAAAAGRGASHGTGRAVARRGPAWVSGHAALATAPKPAAPAQAPAASAPRTTPAAPQASPAHQPTPAHTTPAHTTPAHTTPAHTTPASTNPAPQAAAAARPRPVAGVRRGGLRTSCRYVAHIGDSTSVDLTATGGDITDPAQQLPARYADVGVKHLLLDASGGRSIVEEMPGQVNGYDVAQNWWSQGYRGCWVFALGTNDTANVSAGSNVGMMARIQEMMSVAHGEPVMWVNTVTQLDSGAWSEANEQAWDNTLISALAEYPNMRIFNWASVAQPGWFLPDGIHYNPVGCETRAQAIADALARAFPRYGDSHGQIVR